MGYIYLLGVGLLMLTCVIHAARNGLLMPWIYVIVFLPFIGSLAYLIVNVLPQVWASPDAQKIKDAALDLRDPERNLRKFRHEAELSNSVDARQRLADEYLRIGRADEGLPIYRALAPTGFADDPRLQMGYAQALVETGNFAEAEEVLDRFQREHPNKTDAEGHLLYARALAGQDKRAAALDEYEAVIGYFPGPEALCRYAQYLQQIGRKDEAMGHYRKIVRTIDTSPPHVKRINRRWYQAAKSAIAAA
ncbi:MAG: tetratricopeptide repeat protein [Alphaproteobacteria bacterium]|nr:tetratricopeptide repeat protein [Alphaproteobacteria bacterium]